MAATQSQVQPGNLSRSDMLDPPVDSRDRLHVLFKTVDVVKGGLGHGQTWLDIATAELYRIGVTGCKG